MRRLHDNKIVKVLWLLEITYVIFHHKEERLKGCEVYYQSNHFDLLVYISGIVEASFIQVIKL